METVAACFAGSQDPFVETSAKHRRNICGGGIKRLRIAKGLSQSQLAIKCQLAGWDVDRKLVSKIETGFREVRDCEIRILAHLLDASPSAFFEMSKLELRSAFRLLTPRLGR